MIEIINKELLLQLVGYLCYWQMGFNSVFKGLKVVDDLYDHDMRGEIIVDLHLGELLRFLSNVCCISEIQTS